MPKELLGAQDNTVLTLKYVSAFKDTKYAYYYAILSIVSKSVVAKRMNACDKIRVFHSCLFFLNQATKNDTKLHDPWKDCIS